MSTTEVDIVNRALLKNHVHERVESPDGSISNATGFELGVELAKLFFAECRRQVLRLAPWTCAQKTVRLEPDYSIENHTDFMYPLPLPEDYIIQIEVFNPSNRKIDFEIQGNVLFTDERNPLLLYVYDETNPTKWDPLLLEAVTVQFASSIAYPITGDHQNEVAFAQASASIIQQAVLKTVKEKRQGAKMGAEWFPGLFDRTHDTQL